MVASVSSTELTPFYYRDNFLCLCDTVESQYLDLLRPRESEFLSTFRNISFPAQCLYVRLVSRVGPWFRVSRLHYEELTDIGPLLAELTSRGLLLWADSLEPSELGTLYTRRELQTLLAADISASSVSSKPELLDAIAASPMGNEEITRRLCEFDGAGIVAPLGVEHVELLQLLFFGNRRQSLTEFVLSDLGVARYFPYPMDRRQRLFASRFTDEMRRLGIEVDVVVNTFPQMIDKMRKGNFQVAGLASKGMLVEIEVVLARPAE